MNECQSNIWLLLQVCKNQIVTPRLNHISHRYPRKNTFFTKNGPTRRYRSKMNDAVQTLHRLLSSSIQRCFLSDVRFTRRVFYSIHDNVMLNKVPRNVENYKRRRRCRFFENRPRDRIEIVRVLSNVIETAFVAKIFEYHLRRRPMYV